MGKALFVAIGVSNADGMPKLDGVQKGVDDLSLWAGSNGYEVVTIDDSRRPVTVELIRDKLTPPDGNGRTIPDLLLDRPRIVVYFCGHGLSFWPDQYWVLSAGPQFTRQRISANAFRDTLATYGPRQIAMISDACRTTQHLIGAADPVVDPYPGAGANVEKDRFYSSRDGTASFAVPSAPGQPAFCVFSSVLVKALSGPDGLNLDRQYLREGRMVVSSRSLSEYLDEHVVRAALVANQLQESQCEPGFGIDRDSYIEFPAHVAPPAPPAPPAPIDEAPGAPWTDPGPRPPPFPDLPAPPGPELNPTTAKDAIIRRRDEQIARIQRSRSEWRAPLRRDINKEVAERGQQWPPRMDLLVSGSAVLDIADAHPFAESRIQLGLPQNLWFTLAPYEGRSRPLLAVCGQRSTIVPMFSGLWCAVVFDRPYADRAAEYGVEMLAWGNPYGEFEPEDPDTLDPAEALKGLANGTLIAEDIGVLAHRMRRGKHADPMLGIVCAYLYNSVGDINNIRRMCYYYYQHDQHVPFDIAMLAGLPLQPTDAGGFVIEVPAVPDDTTGRAREMPRYAWEATPAVTVGVAGVTPVVRAGWPHLRHSEHRVHRQCWELIDELAPSPVSTFLGGAARAELARIFIPRE